MSVQATTYVWQLDVSGSKKLVLLALAEHADLAGREMYPSVPRVARMSGLSERQVQRYIGEFIDEGLLSVVEDGTTGLRRTRTYWFPKMADAPQSAAVEGDTHVTPTPTSPVTPTSPQGDTHVTVRVTPTSPQGDTHVTPIRTVSETSREPSVNRPLPAAVPRPLPQPFDLFAALCDEQGQDTSVLAKPQLGRQLAVAKRLVDGGMTETDVRTMTQWLKSQNWITGGIDMVLLEKQVAKWQMSGKPRSAISHIRPTNGRDIGMSNDQLMAIARGEA